MINKKAIVFLLLLFITIGVVSAVDSSNITNNMETSSVMVSHEDNNDVQLVNNSHTESKNQIESKSYTESKNQIESKNLSSKTSNINVGINYQYEDDSDINPTITVKNTKNIKLNISKTYDNNFNFYSVFVNHTDLDTKFKVSVSVPGYKSQTKIYDITNTTSIVFNLKATDSYQLGRSIISIADNKLNFSSADDILVITTAGVPKYKNHTSEDVMEAIVNYADGKISAGKGNLLMLRQKAVDPIDTCFVVKKGNKLTALVFLNASTKYSYYGTISENMTKKEWNNFYRSVGEDDAYSFASLTNGWNANVTYLVLQEAAFHGHICEGTLGGYTITQALLQYYPPVKATNSTGGYYGDLTSYKVLGIPGDSANDAVLFFLDATAGKSGYVGFNTTSTGAKSNMIGFIRWYPGSIGYNNITNAYEVQKAGSGTIIVMEYDSENNKKLFVKETGITSEGTLEELKYNTWWINKINTNPASLVNIVIEKENLTEEQYYYLIGLDKDITYPSTISDAINAGKTRISATKAHGLDYNYIKNLKLPKATRSNELVTQGNLKYDDFKQIGVRASKLAKKYFKDELGITLEKDMDNFEILTTAGYSFINQQSTEAVWDGLYQEFGSRLTRETLLPNHRPIWKPLWFTFVLKQDDGKLMSLYVRYNDVDDTFFVGSLNGSHINNINIETLNNSDLVSELTVSVFPDGNWFNIQSLTNVWAEDLQFDQFVTFLFHGHACPGVQPGFFMSEYVMNNYPLNENESYFYIASSIYCKDDSIEYLLGLSPGLGNYMDQKLISSDVESEYVDGATEEGVLVIWDDKLNVGRAVIMNFKWATIDTSAYSTSDAKRAAQIQAYVDLYKGIYNPNLKEGITILGSETKWITQNEFNQIKAGAGNNSNALSFVQNISNRTKSEAIRLSNFNGNSNSINNSNSNSNSNSNIINSGSTTKYSSKPTYTAVNSITNRGVASPGISQVTSKSLDSVTDNENSAESEIPEEGASNELSGKAYEVSPSKESNGNSQNMGLIILSLGILGALGGYGYIRSRKRE